MLDSPYVRRSAISFEFLGVPFSHEAVSVFTTFDEFRRINPVVKAPTLVCDDGCVLMDSSLIIQFVETVATSGKTLWSREPRQLQLEIRATGLALAACEKAVQIIYERNLRPKNAQYEPWLDRVRGQLTAACAELELMVQNNPTVFSINACQASITAAVTWQFIQSMLPMIVTMVSHPALAELSSRMEQAPEFLKYPPTGPGVVNSDL
jgi:glutathione S-transferase